MTAPVHDDRVWVELVGDIILARIRGEPTVDSIRECQARVLQLRSDTGCSRIMYDALELHRPAIDAVLSQQALAATWISEPVKVAIVVPNTTIAYLARLAFGELNHRVFYSNITDAVRWLTAE